MPSKVSKFSDLVERVTSSCLLQPLAGGRHEADEISENHDGYESVYKINKTKEEEEERESFRAWDEAKEAERVIGMEMLIGEVLEAVSAMKRAYVSLQEAHCPWDPDKIRVADMAVVEELRRLGVLKQRFRRSVGRECSGGRRQRVETWKEVAPLEAAVEELKREVKAKEVEVENLRKKLKTATNRDNGGGRKGWSHQSHRNVSRNQVAAEPEPEPAPAQEQFEATMSLVNEASKSFTTLLLSLMRSAHWDIAAAVGYMEAASGGGATGSSIVRANHAKYALESYVNCKIFQGFDHETFYMDNGFSSLLHPDQYRRDCFTQYRVMKAMDAIELLGILPTSDFGKFCSKKYLSIVHPNMEESLFGDLEQRRQVLAGNHPKSRFYGEFLELAKEVWLLHLLAFSLDPPPSHFEASKGAEFQPQYMESVARYSVGWEAVGQMVGFQVGPGFKLGKGRVMKARVYLVHRTRATTND
ncbi:hypothetical protein F0562_022037 [Nyssa sinensis]|uniref:Uncharacterized protein n=1 Tax=Nyssa sinensis TaxID=561372 RepID=A0A5J5BMB8_9ASTE|nr:hypothetical protein F0562_022037 [Nyssa sinensis]